MRIGLSTSVIDRGYTGIAQYVLALVRTFAADPGPHQFVLFVLQDELALFEFARERVTLVPVAESYRAPVKNIFWHQRILPRLARDYHLDVLHVPSYRRMLWSCPCALVATIHDLAPFHVPAKYDWKRMFYGRVVARWLARRQDQIIAISQTTAHDIAKHFGQKDNVTVIPNGVDLERFSPAPAGVARAVVAQRFGLHQPYFLYVARLEHPGKNHLGLIRAFHDFKSERRGDWRLVLAGSNWRGADKIHAAIRHSPFAREIDCLGFVPDEDLPFLYRGAEVVVCPSLYEGFGLPVLEAMASARPVICSNRGALAEVAGSAAILFNPEDVTALKNHLLRIAADEGLRRELSGAGLAQAQQFNWETTARRTIDTYVQAASQVTGRAAGYSVLRPLKQR
jgi:glycosyltransferase involved in cell wall biosynthesis